MKTRIVLAGLLALTATVAAADQVYKWVDDQGHVHFSQTPPSSTAIKAQSVTVDVPPPDPQSLQNSQDLQKQIADQNDKGKSDPDRAKAEAEQKAARQKQCDYWRERLQLLQLNRRTATVDAQGNMNYLDDDARAKQEQELQAQISKNCGG